MTGIYAHARAPVRVGIAGGGTDLPAWTSSGRVGRCLSLAIAAYTHAVAITRPDRQVVASYRQRDEAAAATEIANGLIRESALMHGWEDGFEVHTLSELSSRGSGLGVSSSIAVALAACFRRMTAARGGKAGDPRWHDGGDFRFRHATAEDAWRVEIDRLRRPIGRQDHMAAVHGGLRLYRFEGDTAEVERVFSPEDAAWLASHLALLKLPTGHDSRAILSGVKSPEALSSAAAALPLAVEGVARRDLAAIAEAFRVGQRGKDEIAGATPPWLRKILTHLEYSALGCKVSGAGGGGHAVLVVDDFAEAESVGAELDLEVSRVLPDAEGVKSEVWA